jgi:hypothetical protein
MIAAPPATSAIRRVRCTADMKGPLVFRRAVASDGTPARSTPCT